MKLEVAFRRGTLRSLEDTIVMGATFGPYVHSEILLDDQGYSGFEGYSGFMRSPNKPAPPEWVRIPIRVIDARAVRAAVLDALAPQLRYNSADRWQCCVTAMLPFEADLDCERPETWVSTGVFCSQAILLILRRLARAGAIQLNPEPLERTHSRGCSPNALYALLV